MGELFGFGDRVDRYFRVPFRSILSLSLPEAYSMVGLVFTHETNIKVMMVRISNDMGLYFMVLFVLIHFVVETCPDFVHIIDTTSEHVGILLPRKLEV